MSNSDKLAAKLHVGTTSLPTLLAFKDGDAEHPAGQWQLKASHNVDDIKLWLLRYGFRVSAESRGLTNRPC